MKKSNVKKSLKKSRDVLEKRKKGLEKILHKKTHNYTNCSKVRSRAINIRLHSFSSGSFIHSFLFSKLSFNEVSKRKKI